MFILSKQGKISIAIDESSHSSHFGSRINTILIVQYCNHAQHKAAKYDQIWRVCVHNHCYYGIAQLQKRSKLLANNF